MLKNLQFSIAERPLHMEGRILPAPELLMDAPVQPREGVWDARRRLFYRGADINTWVVMNYNPRFVDQRSTETFITKLLHMADEKGMKFSEPVAAFGVWKPCPEQDFTRLKQEYSNLQLVLVILGRGGDLYAHIKRTGDTEVGILSQCVQATNVTAIKPQTLGNILLKINAKMGGINNVLSRTGMPMILERPVMIMGADVNHPSAGDGESPSMAAVVASYDRFASKFSVEVRPQPHRVEIIQDLKEMTKLFCEDRDGVGKCKNVPPGTVVDSGITHPSERDFYLCSHQGIQGTSKPTHYHILWDDNDMTMDDIQMLTYSLCHLYFRCTRSVSLPSPAYYAHLAAFRAKVHISELSERDGDGMTQEEIKCVATVEQKNALSSKLYYV
ncbi:protein argonaute-2-like isoform X2 [Homarus americanus]|uniref:protein argonaute-2-like isoform X2 n=1 Tax=Homarus americanus TaxID=6706 RepID=UPI001C43B161|nr:protein argonaute-2-like isoform X2 [Homarus americanus]